MSSPIYLDNAATTPVDPRVREILVRFLDEEFGNAGSRTHEYGVRAKKAVERAREQLAAVVDARPDEVLFTSGATESNNLVILGLARHGERSTKKHIVSSKIEHKAVLEPLTHLESLGFEVTLLRPKREGWVEPEAIREAVRPDTVLVSLMHVNNETGVVQRIAEVADSLADHDAYIHVDAAQGFGKDLTPLHHRRIDFISISGHKIFAPKGIGALIARRRGMTRPPLSPLTFGGGQERGLRPGTLPVGMAVALGLAAELAVREFQERREACRAYRAKLLNAFKELEYEINGDPACTLPHILNLSFAGLDSEAAMLALRKLVAVSNGSACTSTSYEPSHVLTAMGLPQSRIQGALRLSWSHCTPEADWPTVVKSLRFLRD